jgi:hypothetical protein
MGDYYPQRKIKKVVLFTIANMVFQLLSTIPDYCSSNGCLVGQIQMAAATPGRKTQLSELPMRRTPGIPAQVRQRHPRANVLQQSRRATWRGDFGRSDWARGIPVPDADAGRARVVRSSRATAPASRPTTCRAGAPSSNWTPHASRPTPARCTEDLWR